MSSSSTAVMSKVSSKSVVLTVRSSTVKHRETHRGQYSSIAAVQQQSSGDDFVATRSPTCLCANRVLQIACTENDLDRSACPRRDHG